jgi:predicted AAA+ superfamily ATPase
MKRLINKQLLAWKDSRNRKPLIIRGARQVGKTHSIDAFGALAFKRHVKIDFEKQVSVRPVFDGDLSPKRLIKLLEAATGEDIVAGETLLFLDEIQRCPKALAALRYFYEEMPGLHVIAAGSLLEFELEKMSFPAGRVEFMYMTPLTFEEFLIAVGAERLQAERPTLNELRPVEPLIHDRLMEHLHTYFVVGGMPEAVSAYREAHSFNAARRIQDALVNALIQDMMKYEKYLENDLIREILQTLPRHVGQAVKYSGLSATASHYKIKQVLGALEKAMLVTLVHSSSAAGLPLGGNINKSTFKVCMVDIGLMQFLCGIPPGEIIQAKDLLATYKGSLCEQFIGQELNAAGGSQNRQLFYWSRAEKSSSAEVDYLLVRNGTIIPLEIKNGPAGKLKSLHLYMDAHPETAAGIVLNAGNIGVHGNIKFMPLYTRLSDGD